MSAKEIQCLCGSVKLGLAGLPVVQAYCHCEDCQSAHGAAYVPTAVFPADSVSVLTGHLEPLVVKTAERMRCPKCGTFMFTEVAAAGLRSVNATRLPEGQFSPQFHLHCRDAVLPVVDDLPHYEDMPESFGGSGERVSW